MIRRAPFIAGLIAMASFTAARAVSRLEVVYVGGWDCPPCRQWKKAERPRWLASPEFHKVTWIEVEAPRLKEAYEEQYWPLELKPLLAGLPTKSGTPRFLIIKDGKVVSNEFGSGRWTATMSELRKLLGE
jgi:hypothetical protein